MISESAFTECCLRAGISPFRRPDATVWYVPGEPAPLDLRSPVLVATVRSWLMSSLVGMGDAEVLLKYNRMALRLDPTAIWTGLQWQGDVGTIVCAMVALGSWSEEYALTALEIQRDTEADSDE